MLSSTALVCIVYLTSIVDLICVCWNVTYAEEITVVVLSRCRSLHLTLCDLSRPPWHPSHRLDSCILCGFCVCWPPKRRVYNITSSSLQHRKYLLLLCRLLKVSQYRRALIDTASVHIVKGISQHIHTPSISIIEDTEDGMWPASAEL